jgi:hypothetical protein
MGYAKASIKPYIMKEFEAQIKSYKDNKALSAGVHQNRPIVWLIDAAQRLESALIDSSGSAKPGATLFAKMMSGVISLIDNDEVEGIVITFDNEFSIPAKAIAYKDRNKSKVSFSAPIQKNDITIDDMNCPTQEEWHALKKKPLVRRKMYSFIASHMEHWFDRKKETLKGNKWIILSSAVDAGTETYDNPYTRKKFDFNDGTIQYLDPVYLCEGEVSMMWHAVNLGEGYDYIAMSTDGDLIPLSVLHVKNMKNNFYIHQKNYAKDTKDKALCFNVNAMCDHIKNFIFPGITNWHVWFAAMIITGTNDFLRDYCKGIGFEKMVEGWKRISKTPLGSTFLEVVKYEDRNVLVNHHTINPEDMVKLTEEIYASAKKKFKPELRTGILITSGQLLWNLSYWHNQILFEKDHHILQYTGLETCEQTQMPLFGYQKCSVNGLIKSDDISTNHVKANAVKYYSMIPPRDKMNVEQK